MAVLAFGAGLGQVIGVLTVPVIARLYTVEEFGRFQVYLSFMGFATVAVALRYEMAILVAPDPMAAFKVLVLALAVVVATSCTVAIAIVVGLLGNVLPEALAKLGGYVWWIPVGMVGAGAYLAASFWAVRERLFPPLATTRLIQSVGQGLAQLGFGLAGAFGLSGLIVGDLLGRSLGTVGLLRKAWRVQRDTCVTIRMRDLLDLAVRFRQFPLISAGSAVLNTAGFALPWLLLDRYYGAIVLGWFALGERVLGMPTTFVGTAISQVYSSEAARLAHNNATGLKQLFLSIPKRLGLVAFVPYAIIALAGPALFALVFGPDWREAGRYAQLLAVMNCANFMIWPVMSTLTLLEKQSWQLAWDTSRLVLSVLSLALAHRWGLSPSEAILAYGVARLIASAGYFVMCLYAIRRLRGMTASGLPEAMASS